MGLRATGLDGLHQRLELVRAAPSDAGHKTFPGKTLGDGTASGIPCADNQYDLLIVHR
ncbi:hypothetical protein D3C84_1012360 [compost metagenome]